MGGGSQASSRATRCIPAPFCRDFNRSLRDTGRYPGPVRADGVANHSLTPLRILGRNDYQHVRHESGSFKIDRERMTFNGRGGASVHRSIVGACAAQKPPISDQQSKSGNMTLGAGGLPVHTKDGLDGGRVRAGSDHTS